MDEFEKLLQGRDLAWKGVLRSFSSGVRLHQSDYRVNPRDAFEVANLMEEQNPERAALREIRSMDDLIGAADFYEIPGARSMNPVQLEEMVSQRREMVQGMQGPETLRSALGQAVGTAIGLGLVGVSQESMRIMQNMASRVPFMRDALTRSETARDADRWFSMLEEGLTADLPENRRELVRGVASAVGMFPAAILAYKGLGLLGQAPGISMIGGRVSALGRAMIRGGLSEVAIQDPTAPLQEQALNAVFGAALGVGDLGGVLGRTATGAGMGALFGALASEGDPRTMFLSALSGAVAVQGGSMLLNKARRSFPSAVLDGEYMGYQDPTTRDADFHVENPAPLMPGQEAPFANSYPAGGVQDPARLRGMLGLPPGPMEGSFTDIYPQGPGSSGGGALPVGPRPGLPPGVPENFSDAWGQTPPSMQSYMEGLLAERRGLQRQLDTDPMTGLGNRRAWDAAVASADADPSQEIIVMDLGNLKAANDIVGHSFGDEMIKKAGQALPGRAFRIGGDEFAAIVPSGSGQFYLQQAQQNFGVAGAGVFPIQLDGAVGSTFLEADASLLAMKGRVQRPRYRDLSLGDAQSEAANLTKQGAIVESPAFAEISQGLIFDDADVAHAIVETYPGQVGVVQNVGDVASTVRRILQEKMPRGVGPQDFRVVRRPQISTTMRNISNEEHSLAFEFMSRTPEGQPIQSWADVYLDSDSRYPPTLDITDVKTLDPATGEWSFKHLQEQPGLPWARQTGGEMLHLLEQQGISVDRVSGRRLVSSTSPSRTTSREETMLSASRFPRPTVTNDILVSSGRPVTNQMVKDYEQFGMFSGQRAQLAGRGEVVIESIGVETSSVRPVNGGPAATVRTYNLVPHKSSHIISDLPELHGDFESFARISLENESRAAGIRPLELYSNEAASQVPIMMDDYIGALGVDPKSYYGAALRQLLEQRHIEALRRLALPEERMLLRSLQEDLQVAQASSRIAPVEASLEELAAARGMELRSETELVDQISGEVIPLEDASATREFLHSFQRELIDDSPVGPMPLEVLEVPADFSMNGGRDPGEWADGDHFSDAVEDNFDEIEAMLDEFEAQQLLEETPMDAAFRQEAAFSPPPPMGMTPSEAAAMEFARRGEAAFGTAPPRVPPPPPGPPGLGGIEEPSGFFQRGAGNASKAYDEAWGRARRSDKNKVHRALDKLNSIVSRGFLPTRNWAIRLDALTKTLGIPPTERIIVRMQDAHGKMVNAAQPWEMQAYEQLNGVRNKIMRDGTFWSILQAPSSYRPGLMDHMEFTPRERDSLWAMDELFTRFNTEVTGEAPNFRHIFQKFEEALPGAKPRHPKKATWGTPEEPVAPLDPKKGPTDVEVPFTEKDMDAIISRYFRGYYKTQFMNEPYQELRSLMKGKEVPDVMKELLGGWAEDRMWGLDPTRDIALNAAHTLFSTLASKIGIRISRGEIQGLFHAQMTASYAAGLGFRPQAFIRDLPSALIGIFHVGVDKGIPIIKRLMTDEAYRDAAFELAYDSAWLHRGHGLAVDPDLFGGTAFRELAPDRQPSLTQNEGIARIGDFWQDKITTPLGLRRGWQGTKIDPLKAYGWQADWSRLWNAMTGYETARSAIQDFRNGLENFTGTVDELETRLLKDARVSRFQGTIQDGFLEFVRKGDYEGAARYFGRHVSDSQNRFGMTEHPNLYRKWGPATGRQAMKWLSFNSQVMANFGQVIADPRISLGDKATYFTQVGSLNALYGIGQAMTGWNLMRLSIVGSAFGLAGTGIEDWVNRVQRVNAWWKSLDPSGGYLSPEQSALVNTTDPLMEPSYWNPLTSPLNPFAGGIKTIGGVVDAAQWGPEAVMRNLVTGQMGDPYTDRVMNNRVELNSPFIETTPAAAQGRREPYRGTNSFGTPPNLDSTLAATGITEPSRIYEKNERRVVDTDRRTIDGKVPTHSLDLPSGRMQNETWEAYEDRVIAKPDHLFSGEARAVNASLESLQPEMQSRTMALIQAAAAEGVQLRMREGLRSVERQEWLFKEGRSQERGRAPVTWTLTSDHTTGHGADLQAADTSGYVWIQQNAGQFGLQILGPHDAGHVFMKEPAQQQSPQAPSRGPGTGGGAF